MPKMKTHKASKKRFKSTATGKLLFEPAFRGHLNVKKSKRRKARLDQLAEASPANRKKLALTLPYKQYL